MQRRNFLEFFHCKDNYFPLYYCTLIVIFFSNNVVKGWG